MKSSPVSLPASATGCGSVTARVTEQFDVHSPLGVLRATVCSGTLLDFQFSATPASPSTSPRLSDPANRAVLDALVRWVNHYFDGSPATDRPIAMPACDLSGETDFRQRVWQVLMTIPRGQTITYGQLAARCGNPAAVRAVASACAANRYALLIPCHRIVGSGGQLCGYRWGLERKQALLRMETGQ